MRVAWIGWGGAALALLAGGPLNAADQAGVHYVAEELGNRTKPADAGQGASKGLSDSAVRVMSTFALSIVPDQVPAGPGGQMIKLDKSDPNKYLIPLDDARQIIRVATRSAYAEVCQLPEFEKANFDALIRSEKLRGWTAQQMMFIHALHTFATSYFAGNVKITESDAGQSESLAKEGAAAANAAKDATKDAATTITTKKLECAPGQKEKVTAAINTYVQSAPPAPPPPPPAEAAAPQAAPAPAPVAGGAN
ncbi:hypothetical protein [Methyloceanibacter sp.]|uniref:hypothetical protein n=1 Tax=Methyloceanibacter sp. TaxID=1965321 RepID=UPI003D6CE0EB